MPVAFAVGFAGYKFVTALPRQQMPIPDQDISLVLQLLETVPGLPVLAFPTFLVLWMIRGRWSRLSWLLGASLVASVAIFAIAIWIDSRGMDPAEHYSWNGWYFVLIIGSLAATALTLAGLVLARIVHLVRTWLRRTPQPA